MRLTRRRSLPCFLEAFCPFFGMCPLFSVRPALVQSRRRLARVKLHPANARTRTCVHVRATSSLSGEELVKLDHARHALPRVLLLLEDRFKGLKTILEDSLIQAFSTDPSLSVAASYVINMMR